MELFGEGRIRSANDASNSCPSSVLKSSPPSRLFDPTMHQGRQWTNHGRQGSGDVKEREEQLGKKRIRIVGNCGPAQNCGELWTSRRRSFRWLRLSLDLALLNLWHRKRVADMQSKHGHTGCIMGTTKKTVRVTSLFSVCRCRDCICGITPKGLSMRPHSCTITTSNEVTQQNCDETLACRMHHWGDRDSVIAGVGLPSSRLYLWNHTNVPSIHAKQVRAKQESNMYFACRMHHRGDRDSVIPVLAGADLTTSQLYLWHHTNPSIRAKQGSNEAT